MSDIPMMNGDGLLECPFCGSDDVSVVNGGILLHVECIQCNSKSDKYLRSGSAIKAWNTRKGHLWTVDDFKQMNAERNIRD